MKVSAQYLEYILEQLATLGTVRARRMFGAAGLYSGESFFGIVNADTLYLRVDDSNRADYTSRGMEPFRPYVDRPQVSTSYFEVPSEVLEDPRQLAAWGRRALEAAQAAAATGARKPRKPNSPRQAGKPGCGAGLHARRRGKTKSGRS